MDSALLSSSATALFKADVAAYLSGHSSERVKLESYVPHVKVRRLLTQLLSHEPALEIEHVVIRGAAGCSDFVGTMEVHTSLGPECFEFAWDCRWRAQHEGWLDYFGFPDQIRAAQEFDWQCFKRWERRAH